MSQGQKKYIEGSDSLHFNLLALCSRDLSRRKHILDLVRHRAEELANDRQTEVLKAYLPAILRLSNVCPFEDVRKGLTILLQELKENGEKVPRKVHVGPSFFIPSKEVIPLNGNKDDTESLLVESFLASGRLTHVHWLMGYHPQYLECFLNTHFYLMRAEGPLPFDWRCYIAILAASRHRCCYLVRLYESEFLKNEGDPKWLKGLEHIPKKLYNLHNINKILAHQPWTVNSDHMKDLREGEDSWSLSELVQAITILIHFHCLSSFVYGCGVTPEIDLEGGHTFRPPSLTTDHDSNGLDNDVHTGRSRDNKELVALMNAVSEKQKDQGEVSVEKIRQEFENIASDEVVNVSYSDSTCTPEQSFSHYLKDPNFRYKNFADTRNENNQRSLNVNEYSWEEYGFSLVDRFYPEMGQLLDEKFKVCENLTYNTVGTEESVDTRAFRQATWNYIHLLFGLFHDDYRYDEVNSLMEKSYKTYIKKVVCFPGQTTQDDYLNCLRQLTHSEKVHINLIAFESRMQAELLYALRAVMR
ncbi:sestrin-1-like [Dendronephthya gigantea]|uniref:sestrin-1-like n=1 Tax=Dendronephthya gigantea TaxID=151771 RepID=UPI001069184F|nr:sestrin-1-like [Dendronephthya gigantea]